MNQTLNSLSILSLSFVQSAILNTNKTQALSKKKPNVLKLGLNKPVIWSMANGIGRSQNNPSDKWFSLNNKCRPRPFRRYTAISPETGGEGIIVWDTFFRKMLDKWVTEVTVKSGNMRLKLLIICPAGQTWENVFLLCFSLSSHTPPQKLKIHFPFWCTVY